VRVSAQGKFVRQSPYKVRRVLDLVRGLPVGEARTVLQFSQRRAAGMVRKVLESAVANAEHNHELEADDLHVVDAYADEGPTLRRWRPRARGRATRIRKRTSHITIVVAEDRGVIEGEED
jgi:large subunit ribosomal protein L22